MRITIGDLIAGVGTATKTFAPGGKHPHPPLTQPYICWNLATTTATTTTTTTRLVHDGFWEDDMCYTRKRKYKWVVSGCSYEISRSGHVCTNIISRNNSEPRIGWFRWKLVCGCHMRWWRRLLLQTGTRSRNGCQWPSFWISFPVHISAANRDICTKFDIYARSRGIINTYFWSNTRRRTASTWGMVRSR